MNENNKLIGGGYAWLMLCYLKHDLATLQEKSFNDIMTMVKGKGRYIDQLFTHLKKSLDAENNESQEVDPSQVIENLVNAKHEMEMKFFQKVSNLKSPETVKTPFS